MTRYARSIPAQCGLFAVVAVVCVEIPLGADDGPANTPQEKMLRQGAAIYRKQCASCHGPKGEGVASTRLKDACPDPLIGDSTVGELSELIADTMPKNAPRQCVGDNAAAVAAYIHYSFYSEAARIRNRPPRIGLARLTADQLRQSLADLYARLDGVVSPTDKRGVAGQYFDAKWANNKHRKIDRTDPVVDFDFKHDGPGHGIKSEEFTIRWDGGLRVDVTGRYEIVVRSTCSFIMRFGAPERELINNHVQSGDRTEFRRFVNLTAGRVYGFRIDFVQRKRKTKQPPARISLSWVPPYGLEEIIPQRNLIPGSSPRTLALQATLPPDDRSYGYDRGISVDRQWDESTTAAAIEFGQVAADELWPRYRQKHRKDSDEGRAKLRRFLVELVETAFRGSIDDTTRARYVDRQVDATDDDAEAIKRVLLATLKSPRFLYPRLDSDRTMSQRVANRLALTLFDSLPADKWLVDQARNGHFQNENRIRTAAKRMVSDYRTRAKTRSMLYEWLNLSHIDEIAKDDRVFPEFDDRIVADLRASFDTMLDEIVWGGFSDYRQLFDLSRVYTTDRLAEFYGDAWRPAEESESSLKRTEPDPKHHSGILTHPYLMSGLAYRDSTSPIHRGVFLIRYMLGRTIRPPMEAFTPISPSLHPNLTTRERIALQTSPANCQVCHERINSLGFVLENFDGVGRYRLNEKGRAIDSSGRYTTRSGETIEFLQAQELAGFLATSDDSARTFVNRAFQHFVKQPIAAYGPETLDRLTKRFREDGYNIRELLIEIAVIAAMEPVDEGLLTRK